MVFREKDMNKRESETTLCGTKRSTPLNLLPAISLMNSTDQFYQRTSGKVKDKEKPFIDLS